MKISDRGVNFPIHPSHGRDHCSKLQAQMTVSSTDRGWVDSVVLPVVVCD